MVPSFAVHADSERDLLLIELSGFFSASDVSTFAAHRQAAHRTLMCEPNSHVTLVDVTECKIQPQVVVGAFSSLISDPRYAPRRIAFVVGSSLAKMQVRRILGTHPAARCFQDRHTAENWLFE